MYKLNEIKKQLYLTRRKERKNIELPPITILSNTCLGGRLYHDYGSKFLSPTIDTYITPSDFIKFCCNLEYYLKQDLKEDPYYPSMLNFIPAKLDDIHILFGHTNENFKTSKEKWEERKKRIIWNNIVCICTDRIVYGKKPELLYCGDNVLLDFNKIPYKKVIFTVSDIKKEYIANLPYFKKEGMCPEATRPSPLYNNKYIVETNGFNLDNFILF